MKTKLVYALTLVAAAFLYSPFSSAEDGQHEIRVSSTNGVLSFNDETTEFEVKGDYNYLLMEHLQITGRGGINYIDTDAGSITAISVLGGATYNLPASEELYSQFYAGGGFGFMRVSNDDRSDTEMIFQIWGGKRFPFTKKFTYSPFAEFTKMDDTSTFAIYFLSFSYFL